jgi:hypothetical protein
VINGILPHRDGLYTLYAKAQDVIGNESNVVQLPVIVDTTPPLITLNGVEEGGRYKAEIKPQILVSDANLKSSRISLNGVPYAAGTLIGQGAHELWVQADDLAGNQSETRIRFSVLLDVATEVSVVAPAAQGILRTPLGLEASASSSAGVAQVSLRVDGGAWQLGQLQTGRWVVIVPTLSDGVHTVQAQMETRSGQTVESASRSFTVDNTPPQILVTGIDAGTTYRAAVRPAYQASDSHLDTVTATLDGAPFNSGSSVTVEGNHRLIVKAVDKAGNVTTRTLDFVLAPLVLSGSLNLSPSAPRVGQTMVLEASVRNGSPTASLPVHIEIRLRLAADGSIVARFADDARLDAGATYSLARSWPVPGKAGTRYIAQLLTAVDGKESLLSSQEFVVSDEIADVRLQGRFVPAGKVLVYARCARPSDQTTAWCVERSEQNYNPHQDPRCDAERSALLKTVLTQLGQHADVVTDEEHFLQAMRSGTYSTYWISGSATGLSNVSTAELGAALMRGDSLLVDGLHDAFNLRLAKFGGFDYRGRSSSPSRMRTSGQLLTVGDYLLERGVVRLMPSGTGRSEAALVEDAVDTGYSSFISNSFGNGRVLSAGFDLAADLKSGAEASRLQEVLGQALGGLRRASLPARLIAGDVFEYQLQLDNAAGQALDLSTNLPAGTVVLGSSPAANSKTEASSRVLSWQLTPSASQQPLTLTLQAPSDPGKYVVRSTLKVRNSAGEQTFLTSEQQTFEVVTEQGLLNESAQTLQGMRWDEADHVSGILRINTLSLLGSARLLIDSKAWADALRALLTAQGYVTGLDHADAALVAGQLAQIIGAVEKRL